MKDNSCSLCKICTWVLVVGGLHLGLLGIFEWDLIGMLSGGSDTAMRVLYVIVGIAAIGVAGKALGKCKMCNKGCGGSCKCKK
jgi:uncharacterized membrane protein YuzA (DUF378 family)